MNKAASSCLILFSGGTDSTAAAAKLCEKFEEIHLLTFKDHTNKNSPVPLRVVELLRKRFETIKFFHEVIWTDEIIKELTFKDYFKKLIRYRWFMAMTCGFTSVSWHLSAIKYSLENNITVVADGMTKEMMHLPGHMPHFLEAIRKLYAQYGISYINPVRDWAVPREKNIEDKFIINHHGHLFPKEELAVKFAPATTGAYVFELGLFPNKDIKGSSWDLLNQHDCYPFVLYNVLYFWLLSIFKTPEHLESSISNFFADLASAYSKEHFQQRQLLGEHR